MERRRRRKKKKIETKIEGKNEDKKESERESLGANRNDHTIADRSNSVSQGDTLSLSLSVECISQSQHLFGQLPINCN